MKNDDKETKINANTSPKKMKWATPYLQKVDDCCTPHPEAKPDSRTYEASESSGPVS